MRLLSNAHATPHRLYRQNIVPTPACRYCSCPDADVEHIAYQCHRFEFLRKDWPAVLSEHSSWPNCAKLCLIATKDLPVNTKKNWHVVQRCISELFETWMMFQRNPGAIMLITQDSHEIDCQAQAESLTGIAVLRQKQCKVCPEDRLPLHWKPPAKLSSLHRWGAAKQDYNALFSFWKNWTIVDFDGKVPFSSWMHVFLVFLQMGGNRAIFCARCPNVGAAVWKFRVLSLDLLSNALPDDFGFEDFNIDPGTEILWCNKMPVSRVFCNTFGLPLQWSIADTCVKLVRKHIELAAERNLKFKNRLLDTQEFLQLVDQHQNVISLDPLTSTWIRCSRRKRRHLPWEETASNIGKETALCSVSERTLAFWKEQDVHTIRSFFAPAATAKLQFKSKKAFFEKLREILDTNLHFLDCSPHKLCHFVAPAWAEDVPACHFCGVSINFLKYPDKIHRRCKRVVACDASVIASWRTALTELVHDLTAVLDKF